MMYHTGRRAKYHAGASPLERKVRHRSATRTLAARFAVRWISGLPPYNQDPDVTVQLAIDHGVREVVQWMDPAKVVGGCAYTWKLHQQLGHALELVQEAVGELRSPSRR